jgi:hypothetical protein
MGKFVAVYSFICVYVYMCFVSVYVLDCVRECVYVFNVFVKYV